MRKDDLNWRNFFHHLHPVVCEAMSLTENSTPKMLYHARSRCGQPGTVAKSVGLLSRGDIKRTEDFLLVGSFLGCSYDLGEFSHKPSVI